MCFRTSMRKGTKETLPVSTDVQSQHHKELMADTHQLKGMWQSSCCFPYRYFTVLTTEPYQSCRPTVFKTPDVGKVMRTKQTNSLWKRITTVLEQQEGRVEFLP